MKENRKDIWFKMRMSDEEDDMLRRMAAHYGMTMSELMRQLIKDRDKALTEEYFSDRKRSTNWQPDDKIY